MLNAPMNPFSIYLLPLCRFLVLFFLSPLSLSLPLSPVVRVLSACNQAVLAPAVIELKNLLGFDHVTKDLEWKYILEMRVPEKKGEE